MNIRNSIVSSSPGNPEILEYFEKNFNCSEALDRFSEYNKQLELDKDRVRVHGQFYNNIYLGKRIFGPARKQVFTSTIMGGIERRFEIIENQVNHIPFTHEASDKFPDKCRNQRIKCRDDTRVVLNYPEGDSLENFIHANRVSGGPLFNEFIITQAPMENTIIDFWRMVWQEKSNYIFMLISRKDRERCVRFWPKSTAPIVGAGLTIRCSYNVSEKKLFQVYNIELCDVNEKKLNVQLWQADMNNSDNLQAPLKLLHMARNQPTPSIVIDHLGISRAACLVASELCIMNLLKGPSYKHPVQRSVHFLRSLRPFSVETPMQYIFIHRVVQHFIKPFVGIQKNFEEDYNRWLESRSQRLFVDDHDGAVPAYRLLSPRIDPDLLPQARNRERPENRREMHSNVGELPILFERPDTNHALVLPLKYPKGKKYNC